MLRIKRSFSFGIVLDKYEQLVNDKTIVRDMRQVNTIIKFDQVNQNILDNHHDWCKYSKYLNDHLHPPNQQHSIPQQQPQSFFSSFFGGSQTVQQQQSAVQRIVTTANELHNKPQLQNVQGLYIFGSPGSGKTFLMDLFYDQVQIKEKTRVHFNEFMLDVQKDIHKCPTKEDPVAKVATNRARNTRLLCLDEFQVTDIADALILKRLFEIMILNHVVLVATSNRPPEDLYKGGLQRHLFMPFIPFLRLHNQVHPIDSSVDYRYSQTEQTQGRLITYISPLDDSSQKQLIDTFHTLSGETGMISKEIQVIEGRTFLVKRQMNGVAFFDYDELCENVVGSSDFIAICRSFHTICLSNIQQISMQNRNAARRFILLIDEMYNHKVKLYCTAERDLMNLFMVKQSGESYDEEFALERCRSRLKEMQSQEYLNTPSYYEQLNYRSI